MEVSLVPPRSTRPWRLPVPGRVDVAIAAVFLLVVVAEAALSPDVPSPLLHVTVAGTAMASLAFRRRAPSWSLRWWPRPTSG